MWWQYVVVGAVGLVIGSFLNVCVHRLPRGESVVWLRSYCPGCHVIIRPIDNIPLLSYAALGGRCRACRVAIPLCYPLLELANAVAYVLTLRHFGWTAEAVLYALLVSALLVVTWIDVKHQIIPDVITLPGTVVGLLASATLLPLGFVNAVAGVFVGGGTLWLLAWLSPLLFGKEGMGGGDIKLLAMIGAFLGWKAVILTMFVGAVSGAVTGVSLIAARRMQREEYLAFGPFLALGAVVSMWGGNAILLWYLGFLGLA